MNRWLLMLSFIFLVGCAAEKRSYDVTVHNASNQPVTLWLTKDGEPYENGWLSPEDLAIDSPKNQDYIISGVVVAPGNTAFTGQKEGHFDKGTTAMLRVYDGQLLFSQILAVGRDSPLRIDQPLPSGVSQWKIVRSAEGIMDLRRVDDPQFAPGN